MEARRRSWRFNLCALHVSKYKQRLPAGLFCLLLQVKQFSSFASECGIAGDDGLLLADVTVAFKGEVGPGGKMTFTGFLNTLVMVRQGGHVPVFFCGISRGGNVPHSSGYHWVLRAVLHQRHVECARIDAKCLGPGMLVGYLSSTRSNMHATVCALVHGATAGTEAASRSCHGRCI